MYTLNIFIAKILAREKYWPVFLGKDVRHIINVHNITNGLVEHIDLFHTDCVLYNIGIQGMVQRISIMK